MDTPATAAKTRKAEYCRCGVIFCDEAGRITAATEDYIWPAGMKAKAGEAIPAELHLLHAGECVFLEKDWFVQAEGKGRVEMLLFRRIRAADQILGPYGDSAINEGMVQMVLNNPYEGLTSVDREGKVTFLSPVNEKWLGLEEGGGMGLPLSSFAPASRLAEIAHSGVADTTQVVDLQGQTKVTVNLPIRKGQKVIGAVGRILFKSTDQIDKLAYRIRTMELKVERYETLLDEMRGNRYNFDKILTNNKAMRALIDQARRVADSSATVLILGESGTGKELFAQALHEGSARRRGPFVAINCSALPHDLIESELFGYDEGAFSGAKRKGKPGKFELACGGTLFLDEIGELPLESQAKLLRVLEERKVDRLGSTSPISVDFRLLAATNRNLENSVNTGKFRSDLFYRINEFPIELPPLRSRRDDIPLLSKHFLEEITHKEKLPMLALSEEAKAALMRYDWPGNVRELRGLMRQMTWKTQGHTIELHHLPAAFTEEGTIIGASGTLEEQLASAERTIIEAALETAQGNRALTARMLGIHRTALYKKMTRLGMET